MSPSEREQVVRSSHRFIAKCAHKYDGVAGLEFDDFYQEAAVAMLDALARQRDDYPLMFNRRIRQRIMGAIVDMIRKEAGWSRSKKANRSDEEIAAACEQAPMPTPEDVLLMQEEHAQQLRLHENLQAAITQLPEKEQGVVFGHYYEGKPLRALWAAGPTMSKWHARTLRHLREILGAQLHEHTQTVSQQTN